MTEGQAAIATVMASAGDVTVTNPGNWPASALLEIARFDICLYPNNRSYFGSHKANLPTGVDLVCYEGNTAELLDVTQLGPIINYTCEDLYNHPAYYDLTWCFGVACQVGNPLVANFGSRSHLYLRWVAEPGSYRTPRKPVQLNLSNFNRWRGRLAWWRWQFPNQPESLCPE